MRAIRPNNLLRELLDACGEDGALDEATGRAIVNRHAQLTIDGDETPIVTAPREPASTEGEPRRRPAKTGRLFDAPQTIAGQLDFSQDQS